MAETQALPEFANPPVSEVVLGVQFQPVARWSVPQFGLYWSEIRDEYPLSQVVPPIMPQVESFGPERLRTPKQIEMDGAEVRCWFLTADETRLVQVQRDRFLVNWRKVKGDEVYPRYETDIRPKFAAEYERFMQYLRSNADVDSLDIAQCEIAYINEIERGELWHDFGELSKILRPWSGEMADGFLPVPETAQINLAYTMPEEHGRLYAALQHAFRRRDNRETLQLRLTARGKPSGSEIDQILSWFNMGREWIVRGFADLVADPAQALWARKR